MTTAIIGTGGIGSVIARQLASGGGQTLRLRSCGMVLAWDGRQQWPGAGGPRGAHQPLVPGLPRITRFAA
jgi:hypothetical protein